MTILTAILNTVIVLICLFMICLILIQRGKGGGLAGAFGGMGGSSAFGTKSGDVFTRVTMIAASVWIVLSMILVILYNNQRPSYGFEDNNPGVSKEVAPRSSRDKSKLSATKAVTGPTAPPATGPAAPASVPALPDTAPPVK